MLIHVLFRSSVCSAAWSAFALLDALVFGVVGLGQVGASEWLCLVFHRVSMSPGYGVAGLGGVRGVLADGVIGVGSGGE
jgi:hypothetical protein